MCAAEIQRHGPSADALYLLGLVRDASGNHAEAEDHYRKALYLDPDHADALLHLALLIESSGKAAEGELLRRRLRRLEPRSDRK